MTGIVTGVVWYEEFGQSSVGTRFFKVSYTRNNINSFYYVWASDELEAYRHGEKILIALNNKERTPWQSTKL